MINCPIWHTSVLPFRLFFTGVSDATFDYDESRVKAEFWSQPFVSGAYYSYDKFGNETIHDYDFCYVQNTINCPIGVFKGEQATHKFCFPQRQQGLAYRFTQQVCDCICRRDTLPMQTQTLSGNSLGVTIDASSYQIESSNVVPELGEQDLFAYPELYSQMPSYDYRVYKPATLSPLLSQRIMTANGRRMSVMVWSGSLQNIFIIDHQTNNFRDAFAYNNTADMLVMTYRDYGPLIRGEIWVLPQVVNQVCNLVEVFEVG